jgi:hypothetical protein
MLRVDVSLQVSDFDRYDDTIPLFVPLTERQQATVLAFIDIVSDRRTWEPISNAEWDAWSEWLAVLYGEVT